jgi:hypothetical protein
MTGYRPLFGEAVNPILAHPELGKRIDVLNDAWFLVVSLLDEEAIVLDGRSLRGWRSA